MVREQGRQPTEVAKELGICIDTLRSWLKASGIQMGQASRLSREQQRNQALRRRLVALQEKYPAMGLDSLYHLLKPEFGCSRKRVCGWPASPQPGVGPAKLPQIPITAIPLRLTC